MNYFQDLPDYRFLVNRDNPTIVVIGASDDGTNDHYGFRGTLDQIKDFRLVLIEPIKRQFDNLINIYGKYGGQVEYQNVAIADADGELEMLDRGGMSHLASYHLPGDNDGTVTSTKVKARTFNNLMAELKIDKIDLLQIDCEGYEFNILKTIDFQRHKPSLIRYEHFWIPDKNECVDFLVKKNYSVNLCPISPRDDNLAILNLNKYL